MYYSSAGLLGLIVLLIVNHEVLLGSSDNGTIPARQTYRAYLFSVIVYFITDILWGILYYRQLITLTFLDTSVYFAAMACSILFWTRYAVAYLREEGFFGRLLKTLGIVIFWFQMGLVILNFFIPAFFYFDENAAYNAGPARYVALVAQIAMFLMTALYAVYSMRKSSGKMRFRHRTIGLFSVAMTGFAIAQVYFPLAPMYAIGCMLSGCVLHSFIIESEKDIYRDELEEKLRENIRKGNYYDLLTELPGMSYFFDLAGSKRTEMLRKGRVPVFLYMDLSGMKFFNQRHGFAEGDKMLKSFSKLLVQAFGEDSASRFGQDHFVVLTEEEGAEEKLQKLFAAWAEEGKNEDWPAVRVGLFRDRTGQTDISTACDCAKAARDKLRSTYVSSICDYDEAMLTGEERERYIISHLDRAIEEHWIQVYYQPIVRAINGRVCDEEALSRWVDPERGFLSPADFIPPLESAKVIYKLDLFVLEQVIKKMRVQKETGLYVVPHSINLSRSDFEACDIVEEIRRRVDGAGVRRSLITIEITESVIGSDFNFMKREVERFRSLGFSVWLDDFGSGYSSLDVLQSIRFDHLKFDRSFMKKLDEGEQGKIVLTELMQLATALGLDTVCEGVETKEQIQFLQEIGCAKLQGFYYTKPIPLETILNRYEEGIQIGFENPDETAYYEAIGRVNLFDLQVIADENEQIFKDFFNTLPIAIVEVKEGRFCIVRSNPSFRQFMDRSFGIDVTDEWRSAEEVPFLNSSTFIGALEECGRSGDKAFFDAALTDGTVIRAFIRRISTNAVTGTTALAVAVLSVSKS